MNRSIVLFLLFVVLVVAALAGFSSLSQSKSEWMVTEDGLLQYSLSIPEYQLRSVESRDNSSLFEVKFASRDAEIAGLLRKPQISPCGGQQSKGFPAIVLLPGATITKEREQGFAAILGSMGFASITLDQRNMGAIDTQRDLQMFLDGQEPIEHKMVYDALAAAMILRAQPDIDPNRIVYVGESNGGRFAIIACALDPKARGVIGISTSSYGTGAAIASRRLSEPNTIRFYKSIDPETYLDKIPPRKLAMFHSMNDPIIPYEYSNWTYAQALQPKDLYTVKCAMHGHCTEMDSLLENEIEHMVE
jgi:dienelactone hydrolase